MLTLSSSGYMYLVFQAFVVMRICSYQSPATRRASFLRVGISEAQYGRWLPTLSTQRVRMGAGEVRTPCVDKTSQPQAE